MRFSYYKITNRTASCGVVRCSARLLAVRLCHFTGDFGTIFTVYAGWWIPLYMTIQRFFLAGILLFYKCMAGWLAVQMYYTIREFTFWREHCLKFNFLAVQIQPKTWFGITISSMNFLFLFETRLFRLIGRCAIYWCQLYNRDLWM